MTTAIWGLHSQEAGVKSWTWVPNPDIPIWGMRILTGILIARLNGHPKKFHFHRNKIIKYPQHEFLLNHTKFNLLWDCAFPLANISLPVSEWIIVYAHQNEVLSAKSADDLKAQNPIQALKVKMLQRLPTSIKPSVKEGNVQKMPKCFSLLIRNQATEVSISFWSFSPCSFHPISIPSSFGEGILQPKALTSQACWRVLPGNNN